MPLYIAKKGDLDRCHRCLTDSLTHSHLKDRATQLLIKYKSGALVTQLSPDQQLSQVKYNFGAAIYVLFFVVTEIGGIF